MKNKNTELIASDLRVYPSLRMHDYADGGGAMANTPLQGIAGEIFPPVSDVDLVKGAFDVRLLYFAISKAGSASLYGAHALISEIGKNKNISYLLFPASKYGETRAEIMQRIEAHNVATIESRMTLLSTQTKNSRIVQAYQRIEEPLPQVGDVYCLRQDKRGYEQAEQYIQIIKVTAENRTFTVNGKDFQRAVVKMEISTPLIHDFIGIDYPSPEHVENPCKIRETHVADGANYYGSKLLAESASSGSLKIKVPSIFEKLVPTSQVETPLIDLSASGNKNLLFASGKDKSAGLISRHEIINIRSDTAYHLGISCLPNSFTLQNGTVNIHDLDGNLKMGEETIGSIDYARGVLSFIREISLSDYRSNIKFRAATSVNQIADTASISVDLSNRGNNYLINISPPPAPNTLQVSYRAQGKWYDLKDNGSGALRGSSDIYGSGSVNFTTGTTVLTTGALPDVGSEILFSWGSASNLKNRADSKCKAQMVFKLQKQALAPNSVNLTWNDGEERSARDDGAGNISGHWNGKIDYLNGIISINIDENFSLASALAVQIAYNYGEAKRKEFKAPLRTGTGEIELNLAQAIKPRCLVMTWNLLIEDYDHKVQSGELITRPLDPYKTVRDDGSGNLKDDSGQQFGTVEYSSGKIKFRPDTNVQIPKALYKKVPMGEEIVAIDKARGTKTVKPLFRFVNQGFEYIPAAATMPIDESAFVNVEFQAENADNSVTEEHSAGNIQIDLLPAINEPIAPNSVAFVIGDENYFDRDGEIFFRLESASGFAQKCCDVAVFQAAGISALSESGAHKIENIELPLNIKNGSPLAELGEIWQIEELNDYWLGIIRQVNINAKIAKNGALDVRQN